MRNRYWGAVVLCILMVGLSSCNFLYLYDWPELFVKEAVEGPDAVGCSDYIELSHVMGDWYNTRKVISSTGKKIGWSMGWSGELHNYGPGTGKGITIQIIAAADQCISNCSPMCEVDNPNLKSLERTNFQCNSRPVYKPMLSAGEVVKRPEVIISCDYDLTQDSSEEAQTDSSTEGEQVAPLEGLPPDSNSANAQLPTSGVVHGDDEIPLGNNASAHHSITVNYEKRTFSYEGYATSMVLDIIGNTKSRTSFQAGGTLREDGWLIGSYNWYETIEENDGFGEITTSEKAGTQTFVGYLMNDYQKVWTCHFPPDPSDPVNDPTINPPNGDFLSWIYQSSAGCIAQQGTPCCPTGGAWLFDLQ